MARKKEIPIISEKRRCKLCGMLLSIYNTGKECFTHSELKSKDSGRSHRPWKHNSNRKDSFSMGE